MKILYVSQFFKPERVAAAFRAYDNAKIWCENGDDVTIFTGYPNFPTGKLFEGYNIKILDEEKIDGIRVLRSKIAIKENTNKINRIINAISFLLFGIYNILFNHKVIGKNYDIVLGTSGTILAPIIAYIFSIINNIPFILEIRDITYIQMLAVYNGKETILYKLVKWLEIFLCKKAKKIVVVTNGFKEELVDAGVDLDKIEVIHNGINTKEINISKNSNSKEIIFSYMGNIGASQNLKNIIDIFNSISIESNLKKLIIIGDGAKKEEIKNYIRKGKFKNILVKDGMDINELEKYYDISDLCIVSLNNNKFFENTVPSKIFQIMGRGKSIIFFGPKGEASDIISNVDYRFIFTDVNRESIIEKINRNIYEIDDIKEYLRKKGECFRVLAEEKYDRIYLALKYREILKDISTIYKGEKNESSFSNR